MKGDIRHDADTLRNCSGDIILLTPGSIVPADGRLLEGFVSNLESDEALLTGESLPVAKQSEPFDDPDIPLGDRLNMVYAGSQITKGRARAVVISTGMNTELGKIAQAIERKVKPTETGWKAKWYKVQVALGVKGTTPLQMKYVFPVFLMDLFSDSPFAGSTNWHISCFRLLSCSQSSSLPRPGSLTLMTPSRPYVYGPAVSLSFANISFVDFSTPSLQLCQSSLHL